MTFAVFIKALLRNLIFLPTGPALLILAGLIIIRARPRLGRILAFSGLAAIWIFSTPVIADFLMRGTQRYGALDLSQPTNAQAIVILGGGIRRNAPEYGGDAPNDGSLQRITYGARVARATHLPVLLSGGVVRGGLPEAVVMKQFLEGDLSVPVRWVETTSKDTAQNAANSTNILKAAGVHRIILVTTGVHMTRSVNEFEALGLQVVAAPVHLWSPFDSGVLALIPNIDALVRSSLAIRELSGDVVRRVRVAVTGS